MGGQGGVGQRQGLLQNDCLQLDENAVVAKNIHEQGYSASPKLAKVEEHFKCHPPVKALEVICLSSSR